MDADFVPPAAEAVPDLMEDLVDYLNGALHSPLVQAGLVHAQFETIHPFTDGNGRVGRALIHTVLARRGLTPDAVLPISLVLSTLPDTYIGGLTAYRYDAAPASPEGVAARALWIETVTQATIRACQQAARLAEELTDLRRDWEEQIAAHRAAKGATRALRSDSATAAILADLPSSPVLTVQIAAHRAAKGATRALRSDSATAAILADLPSSPVLTVQTVQHIHAVSHVAAGRALEELHEAGILEPKSIGPARRAYVSNDVLDTITWAERRLASTRFDTRAHRPHPGVPAPPPHRGR